MTDNEEVWRAISKASFAVIIYVTPSGEPRSTGVVYATAGQHLYVAVAPDSWKGKHIATNGHVSVTVPVRRGGLMSLLLPIPPATISFRGTATVHPGGVVAAVTGGPRVTCAYSAGAAGSCPHHRNRAGGRLLDLWGRRLAHRHATSGHRSCSRASGLRESSFR